MRGACLNGKTHELVLLAADVRNVHVVGRRAKFFKLLAGEDVDGDQVNLGVAVLAGLGGGHVDDFAGTTWGGKGRDEEEKKRGE